MRNYVVFCFFEVEGRVKSLAREAKKEEFLGGTEEVVVVVNEEVIVVVEWRSDGGGREKLVIDVEKRLRILFFDWEKVWQRIWKLCESVAHWLRLLNAVKLFCDLDSCQKSCLDSSRG
jgi:hypothetical protein